MRTSASLRIVGQQIERRLGVAEDLRAALRLAVL
jgi:hypothetical protein